jgi:hypothetical protein
MLATMTEEAQPMAISPTHHDHPSNPALQLLVAGETVQVLAEATDIRLVVTDRRLIVASDDRVALNIGFDGLRRIQFDIERDRPATLVIVPHDPAHEPQVLPIPPERLDEITTALAHIGHRIVGLDS